MKKGSTLVELMVVIVILSLIALLGYSSIHAFRNNVKQNLWEEKTMMIEKAGVNYGEDNKNLLVGNCTIDGINYNNCINVDIQFLLDKGYISTLDKDDNGNRVVINDTLQYGDENYYVNNMRVNIYIKNNLVYAKLVN